VKPKRVYLDYLRDILENLDKAQDFVAGVSKAQLQENVETLYAVIRALEIIMVGDVREQAWYCREMT